MRRVCVFCGSSPGADPIYMETARQVGVELARQGLGLVYGGSYLGLMGAVAEGVMDEDGEVIGVIPDGLLRKEAGHMDLPDLRIVGSMHERKALMADLADAFVTLPGGTGTLDEFAEIVTWAQIGLHSKPIVLFNMNGYYDSLLAFFDHAVTERFLRAEHRALVYEARTVEQIFDALANYQSIPIPKWLNRSER